MFVGSHGGEGRENGGRDPMERGRGVRGRGAGGRGARGRGTVTEGRGGSATRERERATAGGGGDSSGGRGVRHADSPFEETRLFTVRFASECIAFKSIAYRSEFHESMRSRSALITSYQCGGERTVLQGRSSLGSFLSSYKSETGIAPANVLNSATSYEYDGIRLFRYDIRSAMARSLWAVELPASYNSEQLHRVYMVLKVHAAEMILPAHSDKSIRMVLVGRYNSTDASKAVSAAEAVVQLLSFSEKLAEVGGTKVTLISGWQYRVQHRQAVKEIFAHRDSLLSCTQELDDTLSNEIRRLDVIWRSYNAFLSSADANDATELRKYRQTLFSVICMRSRCTLDALCRVLLRATEPTVNAHELTLYEMVRMLFRGDMRLFKQCTHVRKSGNAAAHALRHLSLVDARGSLVGIADALRRGVDILAT